MLKAAQRARASHLKERYPKKGKRWPIHHYDPASLWALGLEMHTPYGLEAAPEFYCPLTGQILRLERWDGQYSLVHQPHQKPLQVTARVLRMHQWERHMTSRQFSEFLDTFKLDVHQQGEAYAIFRDRSRRACYGEQMTQLACLVLTDSDGFTLYWVHRLRAMQHLDDYKVERMVNFASEQQEEEIRAYRASQLVEDIYGEEIQAGRIPRL